MVRKITVILNLNAKVEIVSMRDIIQGIIEECFSEAIVHKCSLEKVFVEISQNSQENTCVSAGLRPATLLKKSL